jgi:predicted metalloenzyme YecM
MYQINKISIIKENIVNGREIIKCELNTPLPDKFQSKEWYMS